MRNLLLLLIPLYLGFHLFTLSRYPLPEFDEAVLASGATEINKSGIGFFQQQEGKLQNKVIQNSPLIILCNSFLISKLDNILFTHRINGLVFSFLILITLFAYLAFLEKGSFNNASTLLILAILFDPVFNKEMHSSGPQLAGIFFLLISLREEILLKDFKFYNTITSGFFMALALLCYLPIAVFIPFLLLFKLVIAFPEMMKQQFSRLYHFIIWPIIIILFYCGWAFYDDINMFTVLQEMWTPSFFWETSQSIPLVYYILFMASILLLLYAMFQNSYEVEYTRNITLFGGLIISFFLFDAMWVKNIIIILPLLYLLIFCFLPLNSTANNARAGRYIPIAALLGINIILFILQLLYVGADFNNRSGIDQKKFVQQFIPADSAVIGDSRTCFSALENRNSFHPLNSSVELNQKLTDSNIKYVLISEHFEDNNEFAQNTLQYHHYKKTGTIHYESAEINRFLSDLFVSDHRENELYSASVYKKKE